MLSLGIITSTRAEYGLLYPLIKELRKCESEDFKASLIVTGTHLAKEYGHTIDEIISMGIRVDEKIAISVLSETEKDIANNQADTLIKFTTLFHKKKYDAICILGDRYEIHMVAIAATNCRIPIIHICGGDTTEGAIDECIRHSITKMSHIHFVTNEISRRRVIQLGEAPSTVFNVGSTSIDNIINMQLMEKEKVLKSIGLDDCRYALGTYHPVTLENQDFKKDVMAFVEALRAYPNIEFIITKSNADKGGSIINDILEKECKCARNIHLYSSLGINKYLSLMKSAEFVIGNSSSGIIEAPTFRIPTINIGDRQKGRLQSYGTINCSPSIADIKEAIARALETETREKAKMYDGPYGNGDAALQMTRIIFNTMAKRSINIKKSFYDL